MTQTLWVFGPSALRKIGSGKKRGASSAHARADDRADHAARDGAPPDDQDLLRAAAAQAGGLSAVAPHLARFLESLGFDGGERVPDYDMAMTYLALETARRKGHNRDALLKARREAWLSAVGALSGHVRRPPEPRLVRLLRSIGPDDVVVTPCRNILLDRALLAAAEMSGGPSWSAHGGYGRPFRKVRREGVWRESEGATQDGGVRLLKLYGSFGWLTCRRCRADFAVVSDHPVPDEPAFRYPCVHKADDFEPVTDGPDSGTAPLDPALSGVWTAALHAARRADRLVLVESRDAGRDPAMSWWLRRLTARNPASLKIVLAESVGEGGGSGPIEGLATSTASRIERVSFDSMVRAAEPRGSLF